MKSPRENFIPLIKHLLFENMKQGRFATPVITDNLPPTGMSFELINQEFDTDGIPEISISSNKLVGCELLILSQNAESKKNGAFPGAVKRVEKGLLPE